VRWLGAVVVALAVNACSAGVVAPFPTDRGYLDWPVRGADKDDASLFKTAQDVWDGRYNNPTRSVMRPHTDVRPLFAQRYPFGAIVVIQGTRQDGTAGVAVAVLTPNNLGFAAGMVGGKDLPEDPASVTEVSATISITHPGRIFESRMFVLGDPATTAIKVRRYQSDEQYVVLGADYGEARMPVEGVDSIVTHHGTELGYVGGFDDGVDVDSDLPYDPTG
jgi:hypothetical protein